MLLADGLVFFYMTSRASYLIGLFCANGALTLTNPWCRSHIVAQESKFGESAVACCWHHFHYCIEFSKVASHNDNDGDAQLRCAGSHVDFTLIHTYTAAH